MQILKNQQSFKDKYEEAMSFYNNGLFQKSLKLLMELTLEKPTIWQFWFTLAKTLQNLNDYKKAITCFNIALVLDAKNANAHFHLAECFLSISEKIHAKKALKKALEFTENDLLKDQILILQKQNNL